jgi:hypothetical protein
MRRFRGLLPEDANHLILFALPWILLALNPNWPFGNASNLDPWLYWTHARTYPAFQIARPSYYGERLPIILPAYLVHHIFTPVIAQILVHVMLFYVAIYSLYYIIKVIHDPHTALLAATLLGCHAYFIGAVGWDYIDGYGIAYYLLALAFLTRSCSAAQPKWWLGLSGVASAGCFYTNPIWILFLPFFPLYYVVPAVLQWRQPVWRSIAAFAKYFVIGFAGLTIFFGLCAHYVVGSFWFYKASLSIMLNLNRFPEWKTQSFAWMTGAAWMVFPIMVFLASLAVLLRAAFLGCLAYVSRNRSPAPTSGPISAYLLVGNFIYCFLAMCYLEFVKHDRVLEFDFYANVLLPSMFLALGAGMLVLPKAVGSFEFLKTLGLATAVCLLPLWIRWRYVELPSALPFIPPHSPLFKYYLVLPAAVGSIALLVRVCALQQARIWQWTVLCYAIVGFGLVPEHTAAIWYAPYRGPALFTRVAQASDLVCMQLRPHLDKLPFIWYDQRSPSAHDYFALAPALMCGAGFDYTFPALTVPATSIPPDGLMMVLTENKEAVGTAESALGKIGLTGTLISQSKVADNKVSYWISFLQLSKLGSTVTAQR